MTRGFGFRGMVWVAAAALALPACLASAQSGVCIASPGNPVRNGGFEAGSDGSWSEFPAGIITTGESPRSGSYHAVFSVPPPSPGLTSPPGTSELLYTGGSFNPPPAALKETLSWTGAVPLADMVYPVRLFQPVGSTITGTYEQRLKYTPTAVLPGVFWLQVWVYIPKHNPGDSLNVFVGGVGPVEIEVGGAVYPGGWVDSISATCASQFAVLNFQVGGAGPGTPIELVGRFNADLPDPTIMLVKAFEGSPVSVINPLTVPPGSPSIGLADVAPTVLPPGIPALLDPNLPPYGQVLRLGGIGFPWLQYEVKTANPNPADSIRVYLGGTSVMTTMAGSVTPNVCTPQVVAPGLAVNAGDNLAFEVVYPGGNVPPHANFSIDNVLLTQMAQWFETINPAYPYAATANLVTNADFEGGSAGWSLESVATPGYSFDLSEYFRSGPEACLGSAAIFPFKTVPVWFYAWVKVPAYGATMDTLVLNVTGGAPAKTFPIVNNANYNSFTAWTRVEFDISEFGGNPATFEFVSNTLTDLATPTIMLLAGAEKPRTTKLVSAPEFPLTVDQMTADQMGLPAGSIMPLVNTTTTQTSFFNDQIGVFGGKCWPQLKWSAKTQENGDAADKIDLIYDGTSLWSATPSDLSSVCGGFSLPRAPLPSNSGSLRLRAAIAPAVSPDLGTHFIVDDICLSYMCDQLEALDPAWAPCNWNVVKNGNFTNGSTDWQSRMPWEPSEEIVSSMAFCAAPPAAVFKPLPAQPKTYVTLEQGGVVLPDISGDLQFFVRAIGPVDDQDELRWEVRGTSTTHAGSVKANDPALATDKGYLVTVSDMALDTVTVKFEAGIIARTGGAKFAVDDVCVLDTSLIGGEPTADCSVTPVLAGRGGVVTITVNTQNLDLTGQPAFLRLVPQEPYAGIPGDVDTARYHIEIPVTTEMLNGTTDTITATARFDNTINPSKDGFPICTDGQMTVWLVAEAESFKKQLCSFLVDTTPPQLYISESPAAVKNDATAMAPSVSGNDTLTAGDGPTGWPPYVHAIPASLGTLLTNDVHAFLNTGFSASTPYDLASPTDLLNFQVGARFSDPAPRDTDGNYCTNAAVSGFGSTAQSFTGAAALVDNTLPARWADASGLSAAGAVTVSLSPNGSTMDAAWSVQNVAPGDPWKQPVKFVFNDRAGNTISVSNTLYIWWLYRVQALIASGPRDTNTTSPRFEWALRRGGGATLSPGETADCKPIASYKLWRAVDGTQLKTTQWNAVTNWSGWTDQPVVDVGVINRVELEAIRADDTPDKTMLITFVGGDEAGNIQPALSADDASVTLAELDADGVMYSWWTNGQSRTNISVDTDAKVRLMHTANWVLNNATRSGNERSFGTITRVPLPSVAQSTAGLRVAAEFSLRARIPESARKLLSQYAGGSAVVEWTFYEDGAQVASGRVFPYAGGVLDAPEAGLKIMVLPDTLLAMAAGTAFADAEVDNLEESMRFLNPGVTSPVPFDRLGDDGPPEQKYRQREVRYQLVAQTVLLLPGGKRLTDTTPASVEFSVYVPEYDDQIRDEQPVRIYERE